MASRISKQREKLSDRAYATLRTMIGNGELPPGSRLSDIVLGKHIGTGRTPLREALLRLHAEGLVEIHPQSGSFVAPIRLSAVAAAQFIREHLECAIIEELAVQADDAGCKVLRDIIAEQDARFAADDHEGFFTLDEALHRKFASLVRREAVWRVIQQNKAELDRVRVLSLPMIDQIPHLIQQHRGIVDAVAAHDPSLAKARLRIHLREVFATIKRLGLRAPNSTRLRNRGQNGEKAMMSGPLSSSISVSSVARCAPSRTDEG